MTSVVSLSSSANLKIKIKKKIVKLLCNFRRVSCKFCEPNSYYNSQSKQTKQHTNKNSKANVHDQHEVWETCILQNRDWLSGKREFFKLITEPSKIKAITKQF